MSLEGPVFPVVEWFYSSHRHGRVEPPPGNGWSVAAASVSAQRVHILWRREVIPDVTPGP